MSAELVLWSGANIAIVWRLAKHVKKAMFWMVQNVKKKIFLLLLFPFLPLEVWSSLVLEDFSAIDIGKDVKNKYLSMPRFMMQKKTWIRIPVFTTSPKFPSIRQVVVERIKAYAQYAWLVKSMQWPIVDISSTSNAFPSGSAATKSVQIVTQWNSTRWSATAASAQQVIRGSTSMLRWGYRT